MSEWKEVELQQIADVQTGPFGSQLKNEQYITGGTPVVTVEHLKDFRIIDFNYPSVTDEDKNRLSKYLLKQGDIVFTRVGSVDLSAFVKKHQDGWMFSSRMLRVRTNAFEVDSRFLSYYFQQKNFRDYILNISVGATMPSINTEILKAIPVSYPSLPEQKSIASILSCLDDKIDLLHRQNATLEKMAETLFRQWFVERESLNYDSNDFYDGHEFKNQGNQPNQKNQGSDNVEETKEEWEEGTLGDVIEIYDNLRVPLSKMERDKKKDGQLYPYYGAAQIMDYINDYIFDGEYILLGEDGTVRTDEGYPVLQYATGKFWVNNHTHVIRAKQPYNNFFIWNYLKKKNIDEIVTGAVQPKINQANLKSIDFPKYPENLVIEFNKISELFFKKINQNKTQIRTLTALRDTLLPKLMSGEVRVNNDFE